MNSLRCYMTGQGLSFISRTVTDQREMEELHLSNNFLQTIPPEITLLKNLTQLYLSNNKLSEIPHYIGQLTNLEELHLPGNHIRVIPSEIGSLLKLTVLNLADNELIAVNPEVVRLPKLTSLILRGNHTMKFPPESVCRKGTKAVITFLEEFTQDATKSELVFGLNTLPVDMKQLFNRREYFSDVTVMVEETPFYLHKIILCARSQHFKNLLLEDAQPITTIQKRGDPHIWKKVLFYLYSDTIEFDSRAEAQQLYNVGVELEVGLRFSKLCDYFIENALIEAPSSTMSTDLLRFKNNPLLSDLKVVLEDGSVFTVHRAIMIRCEYFRAMLGEGFREASQDSIHLPGIEAEIFDLILDYLYSDTVEFSGDTAIELLITSTQFVGFERLKRKCEQFVASLLDDENAIELFQISDSYFASFLRAMTLFRILSSFNLLYNSEQWKTVLDEKQRKDIIDKAVRWGFHK